MKEAQILHCKLGTMPAAIQLRWHYKMRPNLSIQYRRVHLVNTSRSSYWEPVESWQAGRVTSIDPTFIERL